MLLRATLLTFAALGAAAFAGLAQDPYKAMDEAWISLSGDVAATSPGAFTLRYDGDEIITVEMDDWDWYDEAQQVVPGDRVTVYGRIDDGLYEERTIEADSVYVSGRNTYYYASDVDEEGDYHYVPTFVYGIGTIRPDGTWMSVTGRITSIDGREFTVDNGFRKVLVDTDEMLYNPLDDEGYQKLEVGQRVSVTGTLDVGFFEKDEIKADTIVTLTRDRTKKSSKKGSGSEESVSSSSGSSGGSSGK